MTHPAIAAGKLVVITGRADGIGQPGVDHRARKIDAARAARRDRPVVVIDIAQLAADPPAGDQGGELVGCRPAACPDLPGPFTALGKFRGRPDPVRACPGLGTSAWLSGLDLL